LNQNETSASPKAEELADKKWVYVVGCSILAVVIGASYIFAPPSPKNLKILVCSLESL
jgi:hypothetical protein